MNNSVELSFIKERCHFEATNKLSYSLNNQHTFIRWINDHEKLLRHIINGFEAKPAIQEELFQEIALNIWRALPSFREDASVKTFIARIAHNVLATHVAKAVKMPASESSSELAMEDQTQVCGEPTPYQSLDLEQRQQRLAKAIRRLKLDQQQVITLALEGMSYQEIAETLAISTNLVGVRLQRAKVALSALLDRV